MLCSSGFFFFLGFCCLLHKGSVAVVGHTNIQCNPELKFVNFLMFDIINRNCSTVLSCHANLQSAKTGTFSKCRCVNIYPTEWWKFTHSLSESSPIYRNYCLMHLDSVTQRKWYCVKRVITRMGRLEDGWAKRDKQSCFFTTNTLQIANIWLWHLDGQYLLPQSTSYPNRHYTRQENHTNHTHGFTLDRLATDSTMDCPALICSTFVGANSSLTDQLSKHNQPPCQCIKSQFISTLPMALQPFFCHLFYCFPFCFQRL